MRPAARSATCSTLSPAPPSHLPPPLCAGQGPQEAYSNSRNEWMVVDSNMVTTTGLECDKIGVDYRWVLCLWLRVCCRPCVGETNKTLSSTILHLLLLSLWWCCRRFASACWGSRASRCGCCCVSCVIGVVLRQGAGAGAADSDTHSHTHSCVTGSGHILCQMSTINIHNIRGALARHPSLQRLPQQPAQRMHNPSG